MKLKKTLLNYILFLCCFLLISGCLVTTENVKKREGPDKVQIDVKKMDWEDNECGILLSYYYSPQLFEILAADKEGEMIGLIKNGENNYWNSIYLINPFLKDAVKVADVSSQFYPFNAAINEKWMIWIENNNTDWRLWKLERKTGKKVCLAQGYYTEKTGPDFPHVDIYEDKLVYDVTIDNGKTIKTSIFLCFLDDDEKTVIAELEGKDEYYGAPKIYGDYITWHKGQWNSQMKGEVWLYSISEKSSRKIDFGDNAITPDIWGNYLVANTYSTEYPENKNIVLYDLKNDSLISIISSKKGSYLEYYAPSISHGIVAWQQNYTGKNFFYSTALKRKFTLPDTVERVTVNESFVVWYDRKMGGIAFIPLLTLGAVLEMDGEKVLPPVKNKLQYRRVEFLPQLTPAEILNLQIYAGKNKDYDMLDILFTSNAGLFDDRKEFLKQITQTENYAYYASKDYLIYGDEALACIVAENRSVNSNTLVQKVKLVKEDGYWHCLPNAGF